jgi:hypothetical protein
MNQTTVVFNHVEMHESAHFSPRYGCLAQGGLKAFARMKGEVVHCTSGHLWVTFEDDTEDHLIASGESLSVPNGGKMLVSGPGCFRISQGIDGMDLAAAS